jgi:hypothetical protein
MLPEVWPKFSSLRYLSLTVRTAHASSALRRSMIRICFHRQRAVEFLNTPSIFVVVVLCILQYRSHLDMLGVFIWSLQANEGEYSNKALTAIYRVLPY